MTLVYEESCCVAPIALGQALVRAMPASLTRTKSSPNLTTNSHKERS